MEKQLSIVQDYRYRYIFSRKKVKAENFFKNTAQLGNFFPYMWRSGANLAEKNAAVVRWRNDLKGGARRGGTNRKKWRAPSTV